MTYKGHPDQRWGHINYSQHGDQYMLLNLFELIGIDKPSYLDIGCHDPITISNTALLYQRGSRGTNVDANHNAIAEFYKQRPEDRNLNFGVGPIAGTMEFKMYSSTSGRNTFSNVEVESMKGILTVKNVIHVEVKTITEIVDTYCKGIWPDLLLTDIEGFDYDVLNSMNLTKDNKPKVVCTETRQLDSARVKKLMTWHGYFCYCRMGENLFFVDRNYEKMVY